MRKLILLSRYRWLLVVALTVAASLAPARAADLPLATSSGLAGFSFDDRPLSLPVQKNFQMALLTASSELGRSCLKTEAYGWRLKQSEQDRVDQIFNNTVERMRGLGYVVESQTPTSVARDVTIFTADRSDKHFIFMWSAGEIGLVMTLCESTAPLAGAPTAMIAPSPVTATLSTPSLPSVQTFPVPKDFGLAQTPSPEEEKKRREAIARFSPVGAWVGSYTCAQGYTGGTLRISSLRGENFEGEFRFYPTVKNPAVPAGSYKVYGQYDKGSQRILINPGPWLKRPANFYNTIMVGSFDPLDRSFSAYFQGITGCTSFEARSSTESAAAAAMSGKSAWVVAKKKPHKKKPVKKPVEAKPQSPAAEIPVPVETAPATEAPAAPTSAPAPTPAPAAAETTTPPQPVLGPPQTAPQAPATAAPTPIAPAAPAPQPAPAAAPSAAPPPVVMPMGTSRTAAPPVSQIIVMPSAPSGAPAQTTTPAQ